MRNHVLGKKDKSNTQGFYGTKTKAKSEHKRDKKNGVTVKNVAGKYEGQ